ncbi:hypothetical protein [Stutzerimonas balearica]|uniref:hypothetical protein n=1 Tax=Stutzerimonas balearica TaxID=74829 RepID=UPI0022AFC46F|nr:hypothetical protein [Stutzerimonas balearica]MCZ4126830.1 hypothetical protein [Stutzerimonas balearica]
MAWAFLFFAMDRFCRQEYLTPSMPASAVRSAFARCVMIFLQNALRACGKLSQPGLPKAPLAGSDEASDNNNIASQTRLAASGQEVR